MSVTECHGTIRLPVSEEPRYTIGPFARRRIGREELTVHTGSHHFAHTSDIVGQSRHAERVGLTEDQAQAVRQCGQQQEMRGGQ